MLKNYRVTWAPSVIVTAENEEDAWAKFCDGNQEAQKHPKAFERIVEEIVPDEPDGPVLTPQNLAHDVDSPVDQLPANEAIDRISRMRNRDRLNEIAANDHRNTVKDAAKRRLTEIPQ